MSVMMPSTRELPVGPTAGLLPCKAEADDHNQGGGGSGRPLLGKGFLGRRRSGDSSGSSSSIGVPGESSESPSDEEDEMEVQSNFRPSRPLRTLGSLEDSLPIKRGLSSHFSGKSKSFASLADVVTKPTATASDLAKPENPFNKRRRILMMAKRSQLPRRASCSSLLLKEDEEEEGEEGSSPPPYPAHAASAPRFPPLPLRPLREEQGDESGDDTSSTGSWMAAPLPPAPRRVSLEGGGGGRPLSSFRPPRSFSLTNLQQHQCADDD